MNTKPIESLIEELEVWRLKALNVARQLEVEASTAEPVAVVDAERYTLEGWIAGLVRAMAEEPDGIASVITELRRAFDQEGERRMILEVARDAIMLQTHRALAREALSKILAGTSTEDDRRTLAALVRAFGGVGDPGKAAGALALDPEELARALPILWQQDERDRMQCAC